MATSNKVRGICKDNVSDNLIFLGGALQAMNAAGIEPDQKCSIQATIPSGFTIPKTSDMMDPSITKSDYVKKSLWENFVGGNECVKSMGGLGVSFSTGQYWLKGTVRFAPYKLAVSWNSICFLIAFGYIPTLTKFTVKPAPHSKFALTPNDLCDELSKVYNNSEWAKTNVNRAQDILDYA